MAAEVFWEVVSKELRTGVDVVAAEDSGLSGKVGASDGFGFCELAPLVELRFVPAVRVGGGEGTAFVFLDRCHFARGFFEFLFESARASGVGHGANDAAVGFEVVACDGVP